MLLLDVILEMIVTVVMMIMMIPITATLVGIVTVVNDVQLEKV